MKLLKLTVSFMIFLVSLSTFYFLHALYFNVDVVFYSAVFDGVLASLVVGLYLHFFPWNHTFSRFERNLMVALFVAGGYIFAISVPTVIDRSLSFYILEKLQQRGGEIPYSSMEAVFKDEYMKEHHLIDIRLTEQLRSGTITMDEDIIKLTPLGKTIASASRLFRLNFLPKHRLIMGEYTDVLTDPFLKSSITPETQNSH